jgi:fructose-bisphosphate aldolase class II
MAKVCEDRMVAFGQAGQASKIRQVTLEDMAKKYLL